MWAPTFYNLVVMVQPNRKLPPPSTFLKKTLRKCFFLPRLLTQLPHPAPPMHSVPSFASPKLDFNFFKGRCFRCLRRDHRASHCREPVRRAKCLKVGHKARSCMNRLPMSIYRAMRARPACFSAFVPLSDDFFACQNRQRNAILVDVVPPANLGHFPQETIANGLASCFGGYPNAFLVARYSEQVVPHRRSFSWRLRQLPQAG